MTEGDVPRRRRRRWSEWSRTVGCWQRIQPSVTTLTSRPADERQRRRGIVPLSGCLVPFGRRFRDGKQWTGEAKFLDESRVVS